MAMRLVKAGSGKSNRYGRWAGNSDMRMESLTELSSTRERGYYLQNNPI